MESRAAPIAAEAAPPALQPLDYTSLRAVLTELRPAVVPSRFEKAQQRDPHTLQLGLRGLGGTTWLELSWLAEAPRLHGIPPPPRQGEGSTLARQLQHGLRGLALVELHQPAWERVVALRFAPRPGDAVERQLVLELMGRHSNLFLLDREERVVALARQVRSSQSRVRPIGTGDPYQPPPPLAAEPPRRQESAESWRRRLTLLPLPLARALLGAYRGTSPALVRQLLPQASWGDLPVQELQEEHWQQLWNRWQRWLEALEAQGFRLELEAGGGYRCWPAMGSLTDGPQMDCSQMDRSQAGRFRLGGRDDGGEREPPDPLALNRGLAAYYGTRLAERQLRQRRQGLGQRLRAAIERERGQLSQQQALLEAVPASGELQRQADALLCLENPGRERIEQAQTLYRRARKLRRSQAAITPRLELHRQRLAGLETSLLFLEQLEDPAELEGLERDLQEQLERLRPQGAAAERRDGARGRRRMGGAGSEGPRPLELHTEAGLRLQVGRNHRQNEWISLQQTRRGDLWFHAQEQPGSHVVLKGSERSPRQEDLQAAADVAAHFSRGRGNRRVPVLMVDAGTLQRIPGAEPGTVRHRGGDVLWGEPERALPLLARAAAAGERQPPPAS